MIEQRITSEYLVETPIDLTDAVASMAGEQSTGTFTRVPGETDELRERFAARVESVELIEKRKQPSLPGAALPQENAEYKFGKARISFSVENIGPNLPTIISTVAGNLFELRQLSGLRLLDIEFPESLGENGQGSGWNMAVLIGSDHLPNSFDLVRGELMRGGPRTGGVVVEAARLLRPSPRMITSRREPQDTQHVPKGKKLAGALNGTEQGRLGLPFSGLEPDCLYLDYRCPVSGRGCLSDEEDLARLVLHTHRLRISGTNPRCSHHVLCDHGQLGNALRRPAAGFS